MSIDAIYVYIDSYIIYIELGIVYIEILVFPDVLVIWACKNLITDYAIRSSNP